MATLLVSFDIEEVPFHSSVWVRIWAFISGLSIYSGQKLHFSDSMLLVSSLNTSFRSSFFEIGVLGTVCASADSLVSPSERFPTFFQVSACLRMCYFISKIEINSSQKEHLALFLSDDPFWITLEVLVTIFSLKSLSLCLPFFSRTTFSKLTRHIFVKGW